MRAILKFVFVMVAVSLVIIAVLRSCGVYDYVKIEESSPQFVVDTGQIYMSIRKLTGCGKIQMDGGSTAFNSIVQKLLIVNLSDVKKEKVGSGQDIQLAKQVALIIKSHLINKDQYSLYSIRIPVSTQHWYGSSTQGYGDNIPNDSLRIIK